MHAPRWRTVSRGLQLLLCWMIALFVGHRPGLAWADGEGLAWELVEHATPPRICQDIETRVEVRLRNAGTEPWSDDAGDRLAYHWIGPDGSEVVKDGERTRLPRPVAPGDEVVLDARVLPPRGEGTHRLRWAMVREDVRWYERPADDEVAVSVGGPAFRWSLEEAASLQPVAVSETQQVDLVVRNDGCETWRDDLGDRMAYHWYDGDGRQIEGADARTRWPAPVAPGRTVLLRATVEAPSRPGRYGLRWEPVRENVRWYGPPEDGDPWGGTLDLKPGVLAWSVVSSDVPASIRARDVVEASVRLRNEGTEVWRPDRGDALSYHWRDATGALVAFEGPRVAMPRAVVPGAEVELEIRVEAPETEGAYWLELEPVRENVRWLGPALLGDASLPVSVLGPGLAWSALEVVTPATMWMGRRGGAYVRIRNDGAETWSPERGDHLSYHWEDVVTGEVTVHEGVRTRLPGPVAPGEEVALVVDVRAPPVAGRHALRFEMVREHVRWFGEPTAPVKPRLVRVRDGSVAAAAALLMLALGTSIGSRRAAWVAPAGTATFAFVLVLVLQAMFVERSGLEPWAGAGHVIAAVASLAALVTWVSPPRIRPVLLLLMAAGVTGIVAADLVYLHFFGSIIPASALAAAHQIVDVSESVGALMGGESGPLLAMVLAVVVLLTARPTAVAGRHRWLGAVVLAALAVPGTVRLAQAGSGTLGSRVFSESDNVKRFGVHGAHVFAILRGGGPAGPALDDDDRLALQAWFRERAARRAPGTAWRGVAKGANVIVVQAEALQGFMLDARVDGELVMPFLARWHEHGLVFDQVFDQTEQGNTSDAEYLVLASQLPLDRGALAFLREGAGFHTWMHELSERGYATLSAHPFERGFWNRAVLHPRYGFDQSLFRRELGDGPRIGWGLADGVFFERMVPRLRDLAEPHAALLITLSLHHPYPSFPERHAELSLGTLGGTPLGNYLQAMRYLDRSIEAFVGELEQFGALDDTLLVIYGDHDARLERSADLAALAGLEVWDPSSGARLDRVPLLIRAPGDGPTGHVHTIGGQVDVGPTILHLLGVDPPLGFLGRPLVPGAEDFAALRGGGAVTTDRILVSGGEDIPDGGGCFDYPSGRSRPRSDCDDIAARAVDEQLRSRQILDHDLFQMLRP